MDHLMLVTIVLIDQSLRDRWIKTENKGELQLFSSSKTVIDF